MIGLFEKLANAILGIATGDEKRRLILMQVTGFLFLCFLTLFLLISFMIDQWLHLPSLTYMPWTLVAGLVLLIPGAILDIWTVVLFAMARGTPVPINPPQKLVTSGPYAFSRNPMVLGLYLIFFAVGLLTGSFALAIIFTPLLIIVMTIYVKKVEERTLELRFGKEYVDYKRKVGMYFPRIGAVDKLFSIN